MLFQRFSLLRKMPINIFGSTSGETERVIDESVFVPERYLGTNYIENHIEEDIDFKSHFENEKKSSLQMI